MNDVGTTSIEDLKRIHFLDPRSKLVIVITFSFVALVAQNILLLFALQILILIGMVLADLEIRKVLRILLPILQFCLPILILQAFLHQNKGIPLLWLSFPNTTIVLVGTTSLGVGLGIVLRFLIVASVSLILSLTTDPEELLQGLRAIRIPFEIAFMIGLVLYFIPLIRTEIDDVRDSLATRGRSLSKGSFLNRMKALMQILSITFLNFSEKTKHQAMAMEARGFRSRKKVKFLFDLKFRLRDAATVAACVMGAVTILIFLH